MQPLAVSSNRQHLGHGMLRRSFIGFQRFIFKIYNSYKSPKPFLSKGVITLQVVSLGTKWNDFTMILAVNSLNKKG